VLRAGSSLAVALFVALGSACSLTTTDFTPCEENRECRTRFGFGWMCGNDGYCSESERIPRCNATYPEDLLINPELHTDRIVFGNLMDQSLATHRARERSARLAYKQADDEGGLDGRKFGAVFCTVEEDPEFDGLSRKEAGVAAATYLVDVVDVPAILGPAASDDVQEVFLAVRDRGVMMISPSATSPALSALDPTTVSDDEPGMLWRTAPPDSLQGAAIAYDMRNPGLGRTEPVDTVAVIYQTGAYGEALAQVFADEFEAAGGTATLFDYETDGQRSEKVGTVAQMAFDEVLFISSQTREVIEFMNSAAGLQGFDTKGIFLTDSAANPDLLMEADPTRFDQVRGTRQAPRDEETDLVYAAFLAAYFAEYFEDVQPFSFTANSYDAAWLLVYGSAWSLYQESEVASLGIAKGMRRLTSGQPEVDMIPTNWDQIRQRFEDGIPVDIAGASGNLDYDPFTEETTGRIETWRIENMAIVGIDTWPPMQE
jgi:branched-chain amino acid transport system substrate-binding protein